MGLENLANDVSYEIEEFRRAARDWAAQQKADKLENRTLESLLLHIRILADFLSMKERDKDDLRASDYIREWNEPDAATVEKMRTRINKQLAHLSKLRRELPKEWRELPAMVAEIEELVERFLRKLPNEIRHLFPERQGTITYGLGVEGNTTRTQATHTEFPK